MKHECLLFIRINTYNMLNYQINPAYSSSEGIINNLRVTFQEIGTTIYKIRNEVKVIEYNGMKFCVKSFGPPNIFNLFAYSFFRSSKAKRSYENALRLMRMGIPTPAPVAFVEYYDNRGFISNSFFISLYQEHDYRMDEVLHQDVPGKEDIIRQFARYVSNTLHLNGILHLDFGGNNVLVSKINGRYEFYLIDLNRMRFRKQIGISQGISNLKRLQGSPIEMSLLANHYAIARNHNPLYSIIRLGLYKVRHQQVRDFRRSVFGPFKRLIMTRQPA